MASTMEVVQTTSSRGSIPLSLSKQLATILDSYYCSIINCYFVPSSIFPY